MPDKSLIQLTRKYLNESGAWPRFVWTDSDVVEIIVAVTEAKKQWANNPNHGWTDVYDKMDEAIQPWYQNLGEPTRLGCKDCIASLTNDHRCTQHAE